MSTTVETFIFLQRELEQVNQRLEKCSFRSQQDYDQVLHHFSCTLDDLHEIHQLLLSSTADSQSVNIPDDSTKPMAIGYSTATISFSSVGEREEFLRRMKEQLEKYQIQRLSWKKEAPMEIIRLDPTMDDEDQDRMICKQDEQLDQIHHSIVSLKNLTKNINFEIDDHIRVLDNLETNMIESENNVQNITRQTKHFLRNSADGVAGHTCLFATAVGLFFLIVILILFF